MKLRSRLVGYLIGDVLAIQPNCGRPLLLLLPTNIYKPLIVHMDSLTVREFQQLLDTNSVDLEWTHANWWANFVSHYSTT